MSDPHKGAVLFIECQRGVIGDLTVLPALAEEAQPARAAMGRLATGARAAGARVVHLTYLPLAGGQSANRRAPLMQRTRSSGEWDEAHPAMEVIPEIGVHPEDVMLPRHQGFSPVHSTEVLTILRNLGIDELVVAGVSTNLAIPLTVGGATDENFAVTVPTDASVGTPKAHHESMLKHSLAFVARLATVDEILADWSSPS
jgi:nicotinamidase-related amidase